MIFEIILVIIILLVTLVLILRPDERAIRMLKDVKGFPTLPIIGNFHQLGFNSIDIFKNFGKLWAQSGHGTFKLALGWNMAVFITEPELAETILSSTTELKKAEEYNVLRRFLGNGLAVSGGHEWRKNRRLLAPAFHFKVLEQFVHSFNRNSKDIITHFSKNLDTAFDIYHSFSLLTLKTIVESSLGANIDTLQCGDPDSDSDIASEYTEAIHKYTIIVLLKMFTFVNRVPLFYRMTQNYRDEIKCVEVLHSFSKKLIKERKYALQNEIKKKFTDSDTECFEFDDNAFGQKQKLSFLDILLLTKNEDGTPIDEQIILDEVSTMISGGHETLTSLMSFCSFVLSRHPEIQQKVFDEQYSIFGDDKMKDVTTSDCANMKYLEMVIKETLRMYPSLPMVGRKLQNDLPLKNGVVLPAGITVSVLLNFMSNNPKYVKNPEIFDPERFSYDNIKERHPYLFLPFSAGPRNCIGQKFAMLETKVVLSKIIRNFEFYNEGIEEQTLELSAEITLKSRNGIFVKIRQRR